MGPRLFYCHKSFQGQGHMTINPGSRIRNSKLRGEWAELRFMTRAAEHGLMVSRPWGDSAPYDVMVERQGRVLLVQIKSTMRIVRGAYRCHLPLDKTNRPNKNCHPERRALCAVKDLCNSCNQVRALRESKHVPTEGQEDLAAPSEASRTLRGTNRTSGALPNRRTPIDFLAAYIIPLDLWYILPAPITTRLQGHISLSPHHPNHKYQPYQEAWHLLL
jgi:hypothetical protein